MPKIWDSFDYKVAGHFLSPLINGDYSGLDVQDVLDFDAWEEQAQAHAKEQGFTVGHWSCENEESDDWGICDVTGLHAMRQCVKLMVYKDTV